MEQNESVTMPEADAIAEILENTRATRQYMKWQLIITVAFVILPLLGAIVVVPMVLRSVAGSYGSLLQ